MQPYDSIDSPKSARLWDLFLVFLKIGAFTFGGGFAMISLIQRDLVESRSLIENDEFLDILGVSQCSPGPIAINVAVFSGFKAMGLSGAAAAVAGVTLPSLVTISAIALAYAGIKDSALMQAIFSGIRPAVAGLIAHAAWKLSKCGLDRFAHVIVFLGVLLACLMFNMHPALAIVMGSLAGLLLDKVQPEAGESPS